VLHLSFVSLLQLSKQTLSKQTLNKSTASLFGGGAGRRPRLSCILLGLGVLKRGVALCKQHLCLSPLPPTAFRREREREGVDPRRSSRRPADPQTTAQAVRRVHPSLAPSGKKTASASLGFSSRLIFNGLWDSRCLLATALNPRGWLGKCPAACCALLSTARRVGYRSELRIKKGMQQRRAHSRTG